MNFSRGKRKPVEITLTPMIDVVFLLLIFFMVSTTFNQQSGLKINLSEAKSQESKHTAKSILLTIDAEGTYFVSANEEQPQQLITQTSEILKQTLIQVAGDTRLIPFIISADAQTPHQAVITALDIAKEIGFSRITFATKAIARH